MEFEAQKTLKYYLSGVSQDIIIMILTTLLFFGLGEGIYQQDGLGDPNTGLVVFNASLFFFLLLGLILGSIIFYLIFTRLHVRGIRTLYAIVLSSPFLMLFYEIIDLLFVPGNSILRNISYYALSLILPVFGIIFIYIYGKGLFSVSIRNFGIYLSSAIIGRIMAIYFDLTGIMVLAILLSIFDIYSVFKGPLSKIMGKPSPNAAGRQPRMLPPKPVMDKHFAKICHDGTPVIFSYQNTLLGVGDVLFFSILLYKALLEWHFLGLFLTIAMIICGSLSTLFFLRKISPLPALPLPVFFVMMGYLSLIFLL